MRIIKKIVVFIVVLYVLFFLIFLFSKSFSSWCYEDEVYLLEVGSQLELIDRIDDYYNCNERFWSGDKIRDYKTGNESTVSVEYQFIDVKLDSIPGVIKINILKDSEKPCIHLSSYSVGEYPKKFNRLNSTQLDKEVLKIFEKDFLDGLKVEYSRENPSVLNKGFAKLYLFLHPQYNIKEKD